MKTKTPRTRYDNLQEASDTGNLPKEGRLNAYVDIVHGRVDDPYQVGKKRYQKVALNRKTDPLENEYARGNISEAAYRAGRLWQLVCEKALRIQGGGQWREGDRSDAFAAHEMAIIRSLDAAGRAVSLRDSALPVLGKIGVKFMDMILIERMSIAQAAFGIGGASASGKVDRHRAAFAANMFKLNLELLSEHWSKTAWPRS